MHSITPKRAMSRLALFVVACASPACASLLNGGSQEVRIHTWPDGATATVLDASGTPVAGPEQTPCAFELERGSGYFQKAEYTVRIEKQDHRSQEVALGGRLSGWYLGGNLLFGGPLGWLVIDPLTGGMWNLLPDHTNRTLQPGMASTTAPADDTGISVALESLSPPASAGTAFPFAAAASRGRFQSP